MEGVYYFEEWVDWGTSRKEGRILIPSSSRWKMHDDSIDLIWLNRSNRSAVIRGFLEHGEYKIDCSILLLWQSSLCIYLCLKEINQR